MPNGDWVICDAGSGSLVKVDGTTGAKQTLISGLSYPNGLEVDLDGYLYVAEQNSGLIRKVDPNTGDYEVIASSLNNPNGLAFSPDYQTLYVGSFGAGTVMAVSRKPGKDEWELPRLLASVDDVVAPVIQPCVGQSAGDLCNRLKGGVGVCDDTQGYLECVAINDEAACLGKSAGDLCQTTVGSRVYDSACFDPGGVQGMYCPRVDLEDWDACSAGVGEDCSVDGNDGVCVLAFEGVPVCMTDVDQQAIVSVCDALNPGDLCAADVATGTYDSWCMDLGDWGIDEVGCKPPSWKVNMYGGLDGINTDECNNVYVTEFVSGHVFRIQPSGLTHKAVTLPSSWIPNMRWSPGVGGWDPSRLYVSDRDKGRIFAIDLGHGPRELPFKPPPSTP